MSTLLEEEFGSYDLGDRVSFDHEGERLTGVIARVYFGNNAEYQVEVNGRRYAVCIYDDNIRPIESDY